MDNERHIGIAFSGGGHRASVFSLGAALALSDAGLNRRVCSISSVSGGSIANGVLLVGNDYGRSDPDEIEATIGSACRAIARRGVLLGGAPATRTYVRLLIAAAVVAVVSFIATGVTAIFDVRWSAAALVVTIVAAGLAWRLFRQRSRRVAAAIDRELFANRKVQLCHPDLASRSVHHVVCTTELQSGTQLYLTNRAAYGWQNGSAAVAPPVTVAQAAQASAAVPGAFAPVELNRRLLGFGTDGRVVLSDGGVYDNMADEWEYGFAGRRKTWPELIDVQQEAANFLVVVNGSAGWDTSKPIGRSGGAVELAGLLRAKDVQYDVSTSHRRRALMATFRDLESGIEGVFVQISSSPFKVVEQFALRDDVPIAGPVDVRAKRSAQAHTALIAAGYSPEWWSTTTAANASVSTTLGPLGDKVVANLLEHACVLTAVQLFVIHGIGTLDHLADRERFSRLASGAP